MNKPLLHDEIPIAVVWSKNLTDKDKLVFGEIFTMINQGKPFIMSNKHLAIRLNCSPRTISKSVSHLIKTNWIKTKNIKSETGSLEYREVCGINLLRAMKFSSRAHRSISLGMHEENFYQIHQNNISVNKQREMTQVNRDSVYLHNEFQKIFACDGAKVGMAINGWLVDNTKGQILNAMKNTKARCRVGNPNAIISYINAVIKYPMKPKKRNSTNHRGDSNDSKYNHKARF